ncbi:DnaB-like helicase C-terminal domain-containing protein, partial [Acinetobacter baumannii]|uniref:DnaB-like helicase C-terminal domain-containing protein n=1 Tax=Acinetobacter baumannii TaxID=470 RepID=UPI003320879A
MKAQVICIDYLQLLTASKAQARYQQITSISIALHELAQTTGILVVALAQLNRNAAHASPSTADL